jgi:hypothetical protein
MKRRQVYLVPGFLGFSSLGGLNYFQGVRNVLGEALARQGVEAEIIECRQRDDFPQGDWLPSGSHFNWASFEEVWNAIAQEIMLASRG